jgi:hypothetical protein
MTFTEKTVTGEIAMGPQKMPIDIKHDANVFTDESGLDILLSSLDLKAGFKATVSTVDVMQAKVKENSIAVEAEEHLSIGAGEFNAYKVAVKPAEGDDTILCWYDAATKQLLKKVVPIPTQMGGGNVVFELVK